MDIRITPQKLHGAVTPPASKSMAHRAVLAMTLAGGAGTLSNLSDSQDIQATKRCVEALKSHRPDGELPFLDCGESGSTLRFLIPIALGAMLLGPAAGAWLGFVFGVVVYIQCGVMGMDAFTAFLFNAHPIVTLLICVVKSTLAGFLAGLVYKLLKNKNEILAVFLAAAVTPIVNTGVFIIGCFAILSTIESFIAVNQEFFGDVSGVYFLFIVCAGINFIFEFIINMVMAPAIERIIHIFARRRH